MKHPYQADKLITGQAVNDYWGASATATRPNSMPENPTEEGTPPWLAPQLWADTRGRIANLENSLLTPLTLDEVSTFLKHTGKSAPGTDRIQYDVLRSMCVGDNFKASKIDEALLNFLNTLLRQKQMPDTMKNAMLTFISKAGDPLQYGNYRGISLLSCLFKIITGTLNGRLQHILHDKAGLDTNQGANRKGVHAAHKAAVIINIIADAKTHQKPLHIIYTDIKGAFPSVPFQAFHAALTTLGLNNGFLDLVKDTQTNFTCVAKGPTGLSAPKAKENGVHEGDCLSPTLFCLVLNMFFHWCKAEELGYEMTSHPQSSADIAITIPVNGYADDMALIGKFHGEAVQLLRMLERFLLYYGMELNAGKCGYQYILQDPADRPQMTECKWGNIPIYHGKKSYKYLGYYLNTKLDFHCQHEKMLEKLNDACVEYYNRQMQGMSLQEAVNYVNSDIVSNLRYRMYLISFPAKYLEKFEIAISRTVKNLARLAKSTPRDLLIDQGLCNIVNLQSMVRADLHKTHSKQLTRSANTHPKSATRT
jgi:hypothetical protein